MDQISKNKLSFNLLFKLFKQSKSKGDNNEHKQQNFFFCFPQSNFPFVFHHLLMKKWKFIKILAYNLQKVQQVQNRKNH